MDTKSTPRTDMCTSVSIAALFPTAKKRLQPRPGSMDSCVKEMWCPYTMELHLAEKKNELSLAGKWMGLEIMMLSELSQTQEDKYVETIFKCICI